MSVTFAKIALKQTQVKTGGFSQVPLFDRFNFSIIPQISQSNVNFKKIDISKEYFHFIVKENFISIEKDKNFRSERLKKTLSSSIIQ